MRPLCSLGSGLRCTNMYLKWQEKTITDFSETNLENLYDEGFLFSREAKGKIYQTRSLRIDLNTFNLSSENRRILKKTEGLELDVVPLPYSAYNWTIGKLGKDFYTTKFGDGTFSANKIKELLTDADKSNFNLLLIYKFKNEIVGYCIALETKSILHYSYPFYNLEKDQPNLGMGMMLRAIMYAQKQNKKYIYLGSFQRPTDTYKLQFEGLEWFDGEKWQDELENLKQNV